MLPFRIHHKYNKSKIFLRLGLVAVLALLVFHHYFLTSDRWWQDWTHAEAMKFHTESSFQPRASTHTLFTYIDAMLQSRADATSPMDAAADDAGIYFHWDDWVDLSAGDSVLNSYREAFPEGECDAGLEKFAAVNPYWMESYKKKLLRSSAYTYCLQAIPERIFAMTDENIVVVPVSSKKSLALNRGDNTKNYTKDELVAVMESVAKAKPSTTLSAESPFEVIPYKPFEATIELKKEEFNFNPEYEILRLKSKLGDDKASMDSTDRAYLDFLEYADEYVDYADKYFKYPWIYTDLVKGRAHHLEASFFKRYISDHERQSVVQHMTRAWFEFAQANGIVTWINYGSLLGWVYNGVNMPWDTDVDIQVPIGHLAKLVKQGFNNSLVLENPRYGNGKYLFEISPTFVRQGNGKNFIDARFIEVNSGLYIDISALAKTSYPAPSDIFEGLNEDEIKSVIPVNCKNWNWQLVEEILPIKYATFEGGASYIPHQVSRILDRKYGRSSYTTKEQFHNHNYQGDLNMWVPDRICKKAPSGSISRYVSGDKSRLTLEGACDSIELQDEYQITYASSQHHINYEDDQDEPVSYDIAEVGVLPYSRKDPWDYYHDINAGIVHHDRWYVHDVVKKRAGKPAE